MRREKKEQLRTARDLEAARIRAKWSEIFEFWKRHPERARQIADEINRSVAQLFLTGKC